MMSRDILKRAALSIVAIRKVSESKGMSHRMRSLQQILEELDAGGKFLKCVTCDGATPEVLSLWACTMLVWGSYYSKSYNGMSCMDLAEQKLEEAINTLASIVSVECPERILATDLQAFLSALDEKLNEQMSMFTSVRKPVGAFDPSLAYPSAGFLLPLTCGHNGCLSKEERRYVTHLLKRAGVIQDGES